MAGLSHIVVRGVESGEVDLALTTGPFDPRTLARRQGIYFAMLTLALAQTVYFYAVQVPWTGGENGIQGVPRGVPFGLVNLEQPLAMYFFVLALLRVIHSPFGRILHCRRRHRLQAARNKPKLSVRNSVNSESDRPPDRPRDRRSRGLGPYARRGSGLRPAPAALT